MPVLMYHRQTMHIASACRKVHGACMHVRPKQTNHLKLKLQLPYNPPCLVEKSIRKQVCHIITLDILKRGAMKPASTRAVHAHVSHHVSYMPACRPQGFNSRSMPDRQRSRKHEHRRACRKRDAACRAALLRCSCLHPASNSAHQPNASHCTANSASRTMHCRVHHTPCTVIHNHS